MSVPRCFVWVSDAHGETERVPLLQTEYSARNLVRLVMRAFSIPDVPDVYMGDRLVTRAVPFEALCGRHLVVVPRGSLYVMLRIQVKTNGALPKGDFAFYYPILRDDKQGAHTSGIFAFIRNRFGVAIDTSAKFDVDIVRNQDVTPLGPRVHKLPRFLFDTIVAFDRYPAVLRITLHAQTPSKLCFVLPDGRVRCFYVPRQPPMFLPEMHGLASAMSGVPASEVDLYLDGFLVDMTTLVSRTFWEVISAGAKLCVVPRGSETMLVQFDLDGEPFDNGMLTVPVRLDRSRNFSMADVSGYLSNLVRSKSYVGEVQYRVRFRNDTEEAVTDTSSLSTDFVGYVVAEATSDWTGTRQVELYTAGDDSDAKTLRLRFPMEKADVMEKCYSLMPLEPGKDTYVLYDRGAKLFTAQDTEDSASTRFLVRQFKAVAQSAGGAKRATRYRARTSSSRKRR